MKYVLVISLFFAFLCLGQAQNPFWQRHTIDASFSGADGVRLADLNQDGLLDIATGWEEGGFTKVYLHPGHDAVRQQWPSVVVGKTPSVEDAVFMQLDGQGSLEVISSTEGNDRNVYVHWAPKDPNDYLNADQWRTEILPASDSLKQWMFAHPAQIDGANGQDLVVGTKGYDAQIGWFKAPRNPKNLSKWTWHPMSPATWIMSIFIRDMDGDGDADVVLSDRKRGATNGVRWLENPGEAEEQPWENHFMGAEGTEVMFMDMADLDGDGLEDAIVTEYTHQQLRYMRRLDGSGLHWQTYPIAIPKSTGRAKAVKVGDINGDGKLDLVHSTNTMGDDSKEGILWLSYTNQPTDPEWQAHPLSGPEGYKFDRIELIDLDGDGDLDVLTCEENYGKDSEGLGVIWYENPLENKK